MKRKTIVNPELSSLRLVMVEWTDSNGTDGWHYLDECEYGVLMCKSVGWIIQEDDVCVTVTGHLGGNASQCCGDLCIPKSCITGIWEISTSKSKIKPKNGRIVS